MNEARKGQGQLQSIAWSSKLGSSSKRQAILVLGMHRSGTSAVAGAISGLQVAGPKTLMGPADENSRGFFESTPISVAHDEMLAAAGSGWDDWRQFDPCWYDSRVAEEHRQKIKTLFISEFGNETLIFIKDPRICRFVPFISSILAELQFIPAAIFPIRNPLEVAQSLARRDSFALSKSIPLWLRHVLDAEFHSRHMPRYFLRYEEFPVGWRRYMHRAGEAIGVTWPDWSERADSKICQFLSRDLRRERASIDELKTHPEVSPLAFEVYDIFVSIVAEGENQQLRDRLDLVRGKFNEGCRLFDLGCLATRPICGLDQEHSR